jgi:hypothetical protein
MLQNMDKCLKYILPDKDPYAGGTKWGKRGSGIRVPVHILNNVSIKQVLCYKHLGLIFNDKMTWSDHIDDICKRSNKCLDIISKIRYLLSRLCIEKLYKSFVRSLLDYSDVIYDNCSNIDSTKIENIQRRACIILTSAIRVTKLKTLLKEAKEITQIDISI